VSVIRHRIATLASCAAGFAAVAAAGGGHDALRVPAAYAQDVPRRSVATVVSHSLGTGFPLGVPISTNEILALSLYEEDPTGVRVFARIPGFTAIEGRVTCASPLAVRTTVAGDATVYGVVRIRLDDRLGDRAGAAPRVASLGGRMAGRVTLVDLSARASEADVRPVPGPVMGFEQSLPVLDPIDADRPIGPLTVVFDGQDRLAGFSLAFRAGGPQTPRYYAGLAVSAAGCAP
jgi:hypothetical protein